MPRAYANNVIITLFAWLIGPIQVCGMSEVLP